MKLIHRVNATIFKAGVEDGPTLSVSTSFYRPFLDSGYKAMISSLMDAGCFNILIEHAMDLVLTKGELIRKNEFPCR